MALPDRPVPGVGHYGAYRVGSRQAVRPLRAATFDIYENGRCIDTGLTEADARARLEAQEEN